MQVGELIGKGFLDCVTAWAVTSPKVFTVDGGQDTDPNAIDFAKGYNDAVWGQKVAQVKAGATNSAGMTLVGEQLAPGWDNKQGGTIFQQALTAHPEINATIEANDGLAGAVITDLKAAGVAAKKVPTTGQDASQDGMAAVLTGFQCGSVYKPIYLEAQAAVALATYLRAGQTAPTALVNSTTTDPTNGSDRHRAGRPADPGVGHGGQHGGHRHHRQGRRSGQAVRRGRRQRVHHGRHPLSQPVPRP